MVGGGSLGGAKEGSKKPHLSSDGHIENINLGDNFNFYMIQGLRSGTEYTITINPIFGDTEGPVTATTINTCNWDLLQATVNGQFHLMMSLTPSSLCASVESSSVQTLKVSSVSTSSAIVWWNSVPGATGYRLTWGPTPGEQASATVLNLTNATPP